MVRGVDSDDPLYISSNELYDNIPNFVRSLGAVIDPDLPDNDDAEMDFSPPSLSDVAEPDGGEAIGAPDIAEVEADDTTQVAGPSSSV